MHGNVNSVAVLFPTVWLLYGKEYVNGESSNKLWTIEDVRRFRAAGYR
jgi:hypothetical protein